PVIGTNYYPSGNLFNTYSEILHDNAVDLWNPSGPPPGSAYGFPYDDLFSQSTDFFTGGAIQTFTVTIEPMTTY
ncbi:MAG TPA: hypothetical protein VNG31_10265, partial [Candidatus Baltobacteraceae bacterium]|nr:hypothetical protein [Candidatus Baltobacteraceae bacterium]